ncbi:hypothetical protein D9M72_623920 [compost metagenome]
MAERTPTNWRIREIEDNIDALFLDAERRHLRLAKWLDPTHDCIEIFPTPIGHERLLTWFELDGVLREKIDEDLHVIWIADLQQWSTCFNHTFTAAHDP